MLQKGRSRDTAWFAMLDCEWPARKAAVERWLSPGNFDVSGTAADAAFGPTRHRLSAAHGDISFGRETTLYAVAAMSFIGPD